VHDQARYPGYTGRSRFSIRFVLCVPSLLHQDQVAATSHRAISGAGVLHSFKLPTPIAPCSNALMTSTQVPVQKNAVPCCRICPRPSGISTRAEDIKGRWSWCGSKAYQRTRVRASFASFHHPYCHTWSPREQRHDYGCCAARGYLQPYSRSTRWGPRGPRCDRTRQSRVPPPGAALPLQAREYGRTTYPARAPRAGCARAQRRHILV
jgi:hypothetical protein